MAELGDEKRGDAGRRGVVLPGSSDRAGRRDRPASWRPLVVCAVVFGLVCFGGLLGLGFTWAWFSLLLCLLAIASVLLGASTALLVRFVSRWDEGLLTAEERAAYDADDGSELCLQAHKVLRVGPVLGRPGSEQAASQAGETLTLHTMALTDAHRSEEAPRASAWVEQQHDVEHAEIETTDGVMLAARVIHTDRTSTRWVILAHGYRGHWTEMFVYARHYAEQGFNVLIPEMRGHHESGGKYVGLGWLDRLDLVSWARWIVREQDEGARIVLHGRGMGAAAVCLAAGEKVLPSGVVAAVEDSGYADFWNIALRQLREMHIPAHPTLELARLGFLLLPDGYDIAKASPVEAVGHAQVPILYLQGEADAFVPPYMGKRLYDLTSGSALGENHRLCMFRDAGHCGACLTDPRRYWHEVFAFVCRRC